MPLQTTVKFFYAAEIILRVTPPLHVITFNSARTLAVVS